MDDNNTANTTELDETKALDKIVLFALDEAREKLEQSGELEPFTIILDGENLHIENHPGEDVEACFNAASEAVERLAHIANAYVIAYDGFIKIDDETRDAIIAERGLPSEETAEAFAMLYTIDEEGEGSIVFEEELYSIGLSPSILLGDTLTKEDLEEL